MVSDAKIWLAGGVWSGVVSHGAGIISSSMYLEDLISDLKKQNDGRKFYWYPRPYLDGGIVLLGFLTPRSNWNG